MTEQPTGATRKPKLVDAFVRQFFGPGNAVWPDQDPTSDIGRSIVPYLRFLGGDSWVPVVLPRRMIRSGPMIAYVIAHDQAQAHTLAESITAFVGFSFSTFDGMPTRLDPDDPVERAVLDFAGEGTCFKVCAPTPDYDGKLWRGLALLQSTLRRRPARSWQVHKPLGRLRAEFDLALAAGDSTASAEALERLASTGGLDGANLSYLRIKRLARLGRDQDLLGLPDLPDVAASNPPTLVKDAVLAAFYRQVIADRMESTDLTGARERLVEAGQLLPGLLAVNVSNLSPEAVTVLTLAAVVRDDGQALAEVFGQPSVRNTLEDFSPALASMATEAYSAVWFGDRQRNQGHEVLSLDETLESGSQLSALTTWKDLIASVARNEKTGKEVLRGDKWREWDPPTSQDVEIAELLSQFDDSEAENCWSAVGAFIEADEYKAPAARSALAFIRNALVFGRYSPADLAGLVALTEIVLRSGPSRNEYSKLLDDIGAEVERWIAPENAIVALDLADLLVRSAIPDSEARLRLAVALLGPLHVHSRRLEPDQIAFAQQLSDELKTDLIWESAKRPASSEQAIDGPPLTVLLYSLDSGALERTAQALAAFAPKTKVHRSSDHVATKQLKQRARNADVIVMATRCATHAATGAMRAYAKDGCVIREADGSGSASLFRAAAVGLKLSQRGR